MTGPLRVLIVDDEPLDPSSSEHRRSTESIYPAVPSASSGLRTRSSPEVLLDVDALGRRGGVGSAGSG